jgi:hypothetical protein
MNFLRYCLLVSLLLAPIPLQAEFARTKAVVRSVRRSGEEGRGDARYSQDKGVTWRKLRVGAKLQDGVTIKTAPGSITDLFLGANGPVVRLMEDTSLTIDKLTSDISAQETLIETELTLLTGRVKGNVKKLAAASKYEVKFPLGLAEIRGTLYDISANGFVRVSEGTVTVIYALPSGGSQTLTVSEGKQSIPPHGLNPARVVDLTPDPVIIYDVPPEVPPSLELPLVVIIDPKRSQLEATQNAPPLPTPVVPSRVPRSPPTPPRPPVPTF